MFSNREKRYSSIVQKIFHLIDTNKQIQTNYSTIAQRRKIFWQNLTQLTYLF